jgi:hypothetical protein
MRGLIAVHLRPKENSLWSVAKRDEMDWSLLERFRKPLDAEPTARCLGEFRKRLFDVATSQRGRIGR